MPWPISDSKSPPVRGLEAWIRSGRRVGRQIGNFVSTKKSRAFTTEDHRGNLRINNADLFDALH
jgi:hypothetical protein